MKDFKRFVWLKRNNWKHSARNLVIKKEFSSMQREFRRQMGTLITSALAFVAALFWRDSLTGFFDVIIPEQQQILVKFATAAIVSVIAVFAIIIITKMLRFEDFKD